MKARGFVACRGFWCGDRLRYAWSKEKYRDGLFFAAAERGAHAPREGWPTRIARNGAQLGQRELQPLRYLRHLMASWSR